MAKILSQEEQALRAAKKKAHRIENAKVKQFKHNMEVIRTLCAIAAVTLNLFVLAHILGFWHPN
jgi:hypothetical protein